MSHPVLKSKFNKFWYSHEAVLFHLVRSTKSFQPSFGGKKTLHQIKREDIYSRWDFIWLNYIVFGSRLIHAFVVDSHPNSEKFISNPASTHSWTHRNSVSIWLAFDFHTSVSSILFWLSLCCWWVRLARCRRSQGGAGRSNEQPSQSHRYPLLCARAGRAPAEQAHRPLPSQYEPTQHGIEVFENQPHQPKFPNSLFTSTLVNGIFMMSMIMPILMRQSRTRSRNAINFWPTCVDSVRATSTRRKSNPRFSRAFRNCSWSIKQGQISIDCVTAHSLSCSECFCFDHYFEFRTKDPSAFKWWSEWTLWIELWLVNENLSTERKTIFTDNGEE